MLLKWIVCQVPDSERGQFSRAQSHWWKLTWVPGFLGQLGGWDQSRPDHACILSIWENQAHYEHFMRVIHDGIMAVSKQAHTHSSLDVALFRCEMYWQGSEPDLFLALLNANCLRITDCFVNPERRTRFEFAQQTIWKPAMEVAPGMLSGAFSQNLEKQNRFLIISLWSSLLRHDRYELNKEPELRRTAKVTEDIEALTERLLLLETEWRVLPADRIVWLED